MITEDQIHYIFTKHCNNKNEYWSKKFIFNYGLPGYSLNKKRIKRVLYWNNHLNNFSIGEMEHGISAEAIKLITEDLLKFK